MAKFNIGLNGKDQGAAEGREAWSGELPPTGSYEGVLQVLSVGEIGEGSDNAGKPKLMAGVALKNTPGGKYDGYVAWNNLNLIESSIPYVNQFLLALTDGSDEQFAQIKAAFYDNGPVVDERKKHVQKIGNWKINSPKGELPVKVSLTNTPFHNTRTNVTTDQVRIVSFLAGGGSKAAGNATAGPQTADVEESSVELEAEDADVLLGSE